jgi:hypothetical protein
MAGCECLVGEVSERVVGGDDDQEVEGDDDLLEVEVEEKR